MSGTATSGSMEGGEGLDRLRHAVGGESGRVSELLGSALEEVRRRGASMDASSCAFHVPGRIEVLGKHTDYAGGRSLLAALDRGIVIVALPREDAILSITDSAGRTTTVPFSAELEPAEGWTNYPMTVARRIARNFSAPLRGADLVLASDLPPAAGMSSSSALVIAVFLALATVNGLTERDELRSVVRSSEELAGYLAAIESGSDFRGLAGDRGVGTRGGSQDHTAILCARSGELVQYAFAPVRFERSVAVPEGCTFVVATSGLLAEKTAAARERYNAAAARMRWAADLWRRATGRSDPVLGTALAAGIGGDEILDTLRGEPQAAENDALLARVGQFLEESTVIVPAAGDALASHDLQEFGRVVDHSQRLAEDALGNQVAETVALARSARELGALAASAFGAGFGGSVWALVTEAEAADFARAWQAAYVARFPEHATRATFFASPAGVPARRIA